MKDEGNLFHISASQDWGEKMERWKHRLPEGVSEPQKRGDNFSYKVAMPTDEDGMSPLQCPSNPEHQFKMKIGSYEVEGTPTVNESQRSETQEPFQSAAEQIKDNEYWCPYCGAQSKDPWDFMPEQRKVAQASAEALAEQFVHDEMTKIMENAFGRSSSSRSNGLLSMRVEVNKGTPPPRRILPTYRIEETRRTLTCKKCRETYAVYGITSFCPRCGRLEPIQALEEAVAAAKNSIDSLSSLSIDQVQNLRESGTFDRIYADTIKDGLGALETYLKEDFRKRNTSLVKPKSGTFQRLDDAADLYLDHFNIDLRNLTGDESWNHLLVFMSVRHLLTHNQGIIDEKFLASVPSWRQPVGQKIIIDIQYVNEFLMLLGIFIRGMFV